PVDGGCPVVPVVARVAPRRVVPAALLLLALGMGIVAFTPEHTVTGMLIAFLILGIGLGAAEVVTNALILAAVPANRAGAASAISETAYEFGSVMGTAVLGGLSTFVFGSALHSAIGDAANQPRFDTL